MKEIKYAPQSLPEGYKGFVVIRAPLARERLKYIKEISFKMNEAGEIESGLDQAEHIAKMIEVTMPHVLKVEIEHESGEKIKTIEDLETDSQLDKVLIEIASKVIQGFTISKN